MEDRNKKIKAISYELLEICVKKGLTISEMFDLAIQFPQLIKKEISVMEQKVGFTIMFD